MLELRAHDADALATELQANATEVSELLRAALARVAELEANANEISQALYKAVTADHGLAVDHPLVEATYRASMRLELR